MKNEMIQQIAEMEGVRPFDVRRELTRVTAPVAYPRVIHGRVFETKAEYDEAIAEFLNGN